jgi:hypothetical protein
VFHAGYVVRQLLHEGKGRVANAAMPVVEKHAEELARYILFVDEAKLPQEGIGGDPEFVRDFLRNKRQASTGASLKDLDLRTRMLRHRCSYMLYTDSWQKLPQVLKDRVYYKMAEGLRDVNPNAAFNHLPSDEKRAIRNILKETLSGLPSWWR